MTGYAGTALEEKICEVGRQQKSITNARLFAWQALADSDPGCREAATMAVQEFAENLSKYGTSDGTAGTIALRTTDTGVRIRVKNFACSREDGERVKEIISEINAAPDIGELYCLRQRELFENPSLPRVRLGLLRVAFEGGFRLSCSYEHPLLEIVADRS